MKKQVLAVLAVWLAAVAVVATIASVAIGTAGRQITAAPVAAPLARDLAPTSFQAAPSPSPSRRPRPTASKAVPRPRPTPDRIDPARTSAPVVVPVSSTFATVGGRLRVQCTQARIALKGGYAQPAAGWRVIVQEGGPDQVRVLFDSGGRFALRVVATCVDGGPRFDRVKVVVHSGSGRGGHRRFFSPSLDQSSSRD